MLSVSGTAIISEAFTAKRTFTSAVFLVYCLSCRVLLAYYYCFIFWDRIV